MWPVLTLNFERWPLEDKRWWAYILSRPIEKAPRSQLNCYKMISNVVVNPTAKLMKKETIWRSNIQQFWVVSWSWLRILHIFYGSYCTCIASPSHIFVRRCPLGYPTVKLALGDNTGSCEFVYKTPPIFIAIRHNRTCRRPLGPCYMEKWLSDDTRSCNFFGQLLHSWFRST